MKKKSYDGEAGPTCVSKKRHRYNIQLEKIRYHYTTITQRDGREDTWNLIIMPLSPTGSRPSVLQEEWILPLPEELLNEWDFDLYQINSPLMSLLLCN